MLFVLLIQNHRMVWAGRDLWILSRPTPLPRLGHWVRQEYIQVGLGCFQRGILHSLPGSRPSALPLHGKFFLLLVWNLCLFMTHCCSFCPWSPLNDLPPQELPWRY